MNQVDLTAIKHKIDALIAHSAGLQEKLANSEQLNQNLKQQLSEQQVAISELEDKLNNRNIASAVLGDATSESQAAKTKIAELMREIDKCIALLNV